MNTKQVASPLAWTAARAAAGMCNGRPGTWIRAGNWGLDAGARRRAGVRDETYLSIFEGKQFF